MPDDEQTEIVISLTFRLPPASERTPAVRRFADRVMACGQMIKQSPASYDPCDQNDLLRNLQDLALTMRRAKAAAHNREAAGDGQ
jgi:hypothetical protein